MLRSGSGRCRRSTRRWGTTEREVQMSQFKVSAEGDKVVVEVAGVRFELDSVESGELAAQILSASCAAYKVHNRLTQERFARELATVQERILGAS